MKSKGKTALVWLLLILLLAVLILLNRGRGPSYHLDYQTFLQHVNNGMVAEVWVNNNQLNVTLAGSGEEYATLGVMDDALVKQLSDAGVMVNWGERPNPVGKFLTIAIPLVLVLALFIYFLKKAGAGNTNLLSLRKSRARLVSKEDGVTFREVGGCVEAKDQLGDVIDFLKNPKRWLQAGARLPRGVLLEGPPGTGKTLLARAVAGETNAHFYLISASEFVEMFVGVGAARVRDLFETAAKNPPAVIFVDELDAVGRRRGSGIGAAHDEREQTLNQLLVCMDGFQAHDRVVVIGATNRPDILDPALLRPGRLDRRIRISELMRDERVETLKIHTRNKTLAAEVSLAEVADRTDGFTGAQLENLANEAAILAVRRARQENQDTGEINNADFDRALQAATAHEKGYNRVDSLLIESTTHLAEPSGKAVVRLTLRQEAPIEGEVVWADAAFIKIRDGESGAETLVPKVQVIKMEALAGTEKVAREEVAPDPWAGRNPGLA